MITPEIKRILKELTPTDGVHVQKRETDFLRRNNNGKLVDILEAIEKNKINTIDNYLHVCCKRLSTRCDSQKIDL
jgi:hypothetical protein